METPPLVDISKLKGILGNAKKVMDKVNASMPLALSEAAQSEYISPEEKAYFNKAQSSGPQNYNEEMVNKSNLPENIKRLMIERPIQQLSSIPNKFSIEDLYDEKDEKEIPLVNPNRKPNVVTESTPKAKRITEFNSINSDMITISKTELGNLINEHLLIFFAQTYNKKVTEDAITKTIKTLINEGKLSLKK